MSPGNMINSELRGFLSGLSQMIADDKYLNEQPTIGPGPLIPSELLHYPSIMAKTTLMDWSLIIGPENDEIGNIYYEVRPLGSETKQSAVDVINHWWSNLPNKLNTAWYQFVNVRNSNPYAENSANGYWSHKMDINMIKHVGQVSTQSDFTFISMYQHSELLSLPTEASIQNLRGNALLASLQSLKPMRVYCVVNAKSK